MDFHLILGMVAFAFGCFTVYAEATQNDKLLSKKNAMKKAYGEKLGAFIHFVSYSVIPLVIGIVFIFKSFQK